jgi:glutathione S-transferase
MLKIWGRTNSVNVQKVMWTVGELGLDHERIDVGGAFGGLDGAEFGRLNPNRRIPVLQDGGTVVWESNAIVRYLAARYGTGSLWPEDPGRRAQADQWMDWMQTVLMPDMTIVFWQLIRTPEDQRDLAAVAAAARRLGPLWQILDDWLGSRSFVAGDELTIGDIPVGALYWRYVNLAIDRPSLPNCQLWYQELKRREPYRDHVMLPVT